MVGPLFSVITAVLPVFILLVLPSQAGDGLQRLHQESGAGGPAVVPEGESVANPPLPHPRASAQGLSPPVSAAAPVA